MRVEVAVCPPGLVDRRVQRVTQRGRGGAEEEWEGLEGEAEKMFFKFGAKQSEGA